MLQVKNAHSFRAKMYQKPFELTDALPGPAWELFRSPRITIIEIRRRKEKQEEWKRGRECTKSQRSVTRDFLRYINIITYLLT